jgi:hypothetical protein
MGKAKSEWWKVGPYGQYVGQCCDNCNHYWHDGQTFGCDLGRELYDNLPIDDDVPYLEDKCPDWVSAFLARHKDQPTLI